VGHDYQVAAVLFGLEPGDEIRAAGGEIAE
jgi:hypothetical protein